ncbi:hypothetical protein [Pectobacterium versatile]|uniref:hypothetical protein n=1 Tax=Pectobacterium versatile TaxID=2488639 RepID=UPI0037F412B6
MENYTSKFQEIKIILTLIRYADEKGNVDFNNKEINSDLTGFISNGNELNELLYRLNESGAIFYEEIGEDGFSPIIISSISQKTHDYLLTLVNSVSLEFHHLENRISEILTFNPKQLSMSISETQRKLQEVHMHVTTNELLKPIAKPLKEIMHHFNSVSIVSSNYEDIYKNIIRPVQEEGRSGVNATVKWAIISIVLSTVISLLISNYDLISNILSNT